MEQNGLQWLFNSINSGGGGQCNILEEVEAILSRSKKPQGTIDPHSASCPQLHILLQITWDDDSLGAIKTY